MFMLKSGIRQDRNEVNGIMIRQKKKKNKQGVTGVIPEYRVVYRHVRKSTNHSGYFRVRMATTK